MEPSKVKGKTNWKKLQSTRKARPAPSQKNVNEARAFWSNADVVIPEGKTRLTVRFDTDLVEWFKNHGPKYQTRMNAVLRQFMCSEPRVASNVRPATQSELSENAVAAVIRTQTVEEYLEALNQLGKICLHRGNPESASRYFQEAVKCYQREIEGNRFASGVLQSPIYSAEEHSSREVRESDGTYLSSASVKGHKNKMFIHIAMFCWKASATAKKIDNALNQIASLANKVPDIIDIRCGKNIHPESKGLTHAIVVLAKTQEALDAYRNHSDHKVAASIIESMEADGLGCDFQDTGKRS